MKYKVGDVLRSSLPGHADVLIEGVNLELRSYSTKIYSPSKPQEFWNSLLSENYLDTLKFSLLAPPEPFEGEIEFYV